MTHENLPPPSSWVVEHSALFAPRGEVLDVAAGSGRHTRWLLAQGRRICAIDRDVSALADLAGQPDVEILECDLENGAGWPLGPRRFDGVVVTNYLHRPILPAIIASIRPGGALIYETFAVGNERFGRPSNPDFLLRPNELIEAVRATMRILAYQDIELGAPRAAMVQRIAALRSL
jgi:SAM-dependent methyltransferase